MSIVNVRVRLEKLIFDLDIANLNRLGVMGHGYGGYSTLSLIVQTKVFKTAVDSPGIVNLFPRTPRWMRLARPSESAGCEASEECPLTHGSIEMLTGLSPNMNTPFGPERWF